jgi:hypothetical protein
VSLEEKSNEPFSGNKGKQIVIMRSLIGTVRHERSRAANIRQERLRVGNLFHVPNREKS